MNLRSQSRESSDLGPLDKYRTGLFTLLFTDVVGSTQLKATLGDQTGVTLIQSHHACIRELLRSFPEAEEINTAGDSFLLVFAKPSAALRFAVQLHQRLGELNQGRAVKVEDRIGLHMGEVVIEETTAGKRDIHGMQVDTCARVMSLSQAGQILMTRPVFDNARQSLKGEEIAGASRLEWLNHGRFELKGIEEPMEICEVRGAGAANLSPPTTSDKARRVEAAEGEAVLGWRPAVGTAVPNTKWVLQDKLGEGGFGEVWLGQHQLMKERRVFKFCFRADRVRSLKREMTLFRLIKERIGDHPNIVSLREVYFDQPPYYVEEDYVAGQDLANWCATQGGVDKVPLETKLEIVAQVADALQAAHEAGVIHRDVKPANILISGAEPRAEVSSNERQPLAKLTDFGIGQVVSAEVLSGMTQAGFTQTLAGSSSAGETGTHLYMAPELLAGRPASTRSDIYALGVVLYQLVISDLKHPVTTDWARGVDDPLLGEDLQQCFAGNPEERFSGAGQLAKNLRAWKQRKADLARLQDEERERQRLSRDSLRRRKLLLAVGAAASVLTAVALALLHGLTRARHEAYVARLNSYAADMKAAQAALQRNNLGLARELLEEYRPKPGALDLRGVEWGYLWEAARGDHVHAWSQPSMVTGARFSPDGTLVVSSGLDGCLRVWDAAGRAPEPLAVIERGVRDDDSLVSFCFSPDGRTLASVHQDGVIVLFDTRTWQTVRRLSLPVEERGFVFTWVCLIYSPDGRWLAAKLGDVVRIWDTQEYKTKRLPTSAKWRIAFAPDSHTLGLSDSTANLVFLWDLSSAKKTGEFRGLHHPAIIAFSPDGILVAAGNWDGQFSVWSRVTGETVWTNSAHRGRINGLAFSSDGAWLSSAGHDQLIHLWDVKTHQKTRTFKGHLNEVWSIHFSTDNRLLVSASKDRTVRLWDMGSQPPASSWSPEPDEWLLGYGKQGVRVIGIITPPAFRHWEGARLVKTVKMEQPSRAEEPFGPLFCPQTLNMLSGTTNCLVYLRSSENGKTVRTLKIAGLRGLTGVSANEQWLAGERGSAEGERGLWVWDLQSGEAVVHVPEWAWPHWVHAFSDNGRYLAVGTTNYNIKVWDLVSRRQLYTLSGHAWHALSLAFSSDSKLLVTGSWDGEARVWDMRDGRQVAGPFRGHGSGVDAVCLSPDGRTLATSGSDYSVRLWHVPTGREMLTFEDANRSHLSLFSPSGGLLVFSDTRSNTLRLHKIPSVEEIDGVAGQGGLQPPGRATHQAPSGPD